MIRPAALVLALALSACATGSGPERTIDDPAVQRLLALPVPEYFATLSITADIARNCARYRYDAELDSALNRLRNANGSGTLAAAGLRNAILLETDVAERSFAARHGLMRFGGDLCPAADAEVLQSTAISALLVPL